METSAMNKPSHVISKRNNKLIEKLLGRDRISVCTVFAQVVSEYENEWGMVGIGPLCLTHDFHLNAFILTLIDKNCQRVVWESELTHSMDYMWVSEKFHILQLDQMMGINFICHLEAQEFKTRILEIRNYIKVTSLDSGTNSSNKGQTKIKTTNSFTSLSQLKIKYTRSAPIQKLKSSSFGISYVKKYYKKLTKHKVDYQKLDETSFSAPTSPMKKNWSTLPFERDYKEENPYQTLNEVSSQPRKYHTLPSNPKTLV